MPSAHIINHTHWDREWFLTHEYTTAWIPALIESLERLAAENPDYEFLFDGQSLVIEDLMNTRSEYRDRVTALIGKGNLSIGPVYSQPDWRMVSGELHMRNVEYGVGDAEAFGGTADVAWLVDTFGHISQAPQILRFAGVEAAYVWRGVPRMTPLFTWEGPDGTQLPAIDLFGGYRNLYGITKTAEIAVDRLVAEVDKLAPSYGELPIPLFDGYDLDTEPEDPVRYYAELDVPDRIEVVASSPRTYVDAVLPHLDASPTIRGELLSGKFGSTFPGSLSSRTYLKLLHHDAEFAMHRRVEPLAAMAAMSGRRSWDGAKYEELSRTLLQNGVHDCLCGVSIDQVHERMERSYRRIIAFANQRQTELATSLLDGFTDGRYAISTAAWPMHTTVRVDDAAVEVTTEGVGITTVNVSAPVTALDETIERFETANEHYSAVADRTGLHIDGRLILRIAIVADAGDTYSSEPGETLGVLEPVGPITLVDRSELDQTIRIPLRWSNDDIDVRATVEARFDSGAVVHLGVELDSDGTGFRVDAAFETGISAATAHASMPFDVVERPHEDRDLFGHDVDPAMAAILMGQRETGRVTEFPMHDFVALSSSDRTAAVLAKGVRSYQTDDAGTITVTLRRAAEWLALTGLELRSGDAGPMMYVPTARSERSVIHRLGYLSLVGPLPSSDLHQINEAFHNPPMIADVEGGPVDGPSSWPVVEAALPLTGLRCTDTGETAMRLWNPHDEPARLSTPLALRSMRGEDLGEVDELRSRQIVNAVIVAPAFPADTSDGGSVTVLSPLEARGGTSRSLPATAELDGLDARIEQLDADLVATVAAIESSHGTERWIATHRQYVVERELLELRLSRELNRRLLASRDEVSIPDEPDPVIADLGADLNDLRVKRRIYDYVVQALTPTQ